MKRITDYSPGFFDGKRVLVRVDYNVGFKDSQGKTIINDDSRIRLSLPTLRFLVEAGGRVILMSHLGRPEKDFDHKLSLLPVAQKLNELAFGLIGYKKKVLFSSKTVGNIAQDWTKKLEKGQILLLENLRFYVGEENNDAVFAKRLAKLGHFYVNDAFSASHREHASIVGLPKILPSAAGLALDKEISSLKKILNNPCRPLVLVIGGIKEDKLEFASQVVDWVDQILLGGLLPEKVNNFPKLTKNKKVISGCLRPDRQDLDKQSQEGFKKVISQAKTIIFAGPVSNVDQNYWQGTKELLE
ncbi:MAG: phosphoglycerate kinase, partial [Candidatus Shapirobacteria bacterium]|nr:phosphoglycerate kinase [Candidatus Shapirobacteria bacterium]